MTRTRSTFLIAAALSVALTVLPAQAQSVWKQAFGHQMAELLESPDADVQETALRLIIEQADRNDPDIVLEPATEGLLDVYTSSPVRAHRQMAVAALSKIDDADAYITLLQEALNEQDMGLQLMLLQAVVRSNSINWPNVATAYNELLKTVSIPGIRFAAGM